MIIAHVGSTESNEDDRFHTDMMTDWFIKNNPEILDQRFENDYIDLNEGRDFLKENKKYDIVILHYIYAPSHFSGRTQGYFGTSSEHTPQNWARRLVGTDAKYIFTVGGITEVSGMYLGNLPGYIREDPRDMFTVYRKMTE